MTRFIIRAIYICISYMVFIPCFTLAQDAFITTWKTTTANDTISIPNKGGDAFTDFDYEIDWGDGTVEQITGDDPDAIHVYSEPDEYTVMINGIFPNIYLNALSGSGDKENAQKLISLDQWGNISWETLEKAFSGASNMIYRATDSPDLSNVQSLSQTFASIDSFESGIEDWDVSGVIIMDYTFAFISTFNEDVSNWDVSNVITMQALFAQTSFNQDISSWDVSSVTNMTQIFDRTPFNQNISEWNTSQVVTMNSMFSEASAFNQNIGGWDVSNVNSMRGMFFGARRFNQDIGSWDVSNVNSMLNMFFGANQFNQDIGNWNVGSVTSMENMFYQASAFDQNIGNWDVSNVQSFDNESFGGFLDGTALSSENYDSLLIGWSQLELQNGLSFNAGQSTYSSEGEASRQQIIDNYGWTISDGGLAAATNTTEPRNEGPMVYKISQNYPNPFNPVTKIHYSIPRASKVTVQVYNLLGEHIETLVNKQQGTGSYTITFDASHLSSGVYFYRISAGDFFQSKKMLLIK